MGRILLGFILFGLGCGPQKQVGQPKPPPLVLDLGQPFDQATRSAEDPPEEVQKPADRTLTKKPTYQLVERVKEVWPKVLLTDSSGKPRPIRARIETSVGAIVVELRPDWAPNHVRNFLSLAQIGYYDGLRMDRIQQRETEKGSVVSWIEGGCPLGEGKNPSGSIGYWLRQEKGPATIDGEGLMGSCLEGSPDSGATRFFLSIQPNRAEGDDRTFFGKVVEGMEVVRKISLRPFIILEDEPPGSHAPETPVEILRVVEVGAPPEQTPPLP